MFNRILLPLDGSETSESILAWVMPLAARWKSEIILTTVIEANPKPEFALTPGGFGPSAVPPEVISAREGLRDTYERAVTAATRYLESVERRFRDDSVDISYEVVSGAPEERIVEEAIEREVDLIAMATHRVAGQSRCARKRRRPGASVIAAACAAATAQEIIRRDGRCRSRIRADHQRGRSAGPLGEFRICDGVRQGVGRCDGCPAPSGHGDGRGLHGTTQLGRVARPLLHRRTAPI